MTNTMLITLFALATIKNDLPQGLLSAVCWVESNHKVSAIHEDDGGASSLGICQIKLDTARMLGFKGPEKLLMLPSVNIHYAARYLKWQLTRYHNNVPKALAAYNAGSFKPSNSCHIATKQCVAVNETYVHKVVHAWINER